MKKRKRMLRLAGQGASIALGCLLFAMGVALFLDPLAIAPGGLSGAAILLHAVLPVETGALLLILNIPLLIWGRIKFGRSFTFNTVYATVLCSVFIDLVAWLTRDLPLITTQPLLGSIAGSACSAFGAGLVLRNGCTTGGIDILVKILRGRFPHIKSGTLTMAMDAAIVGLAGLVYRDGEKILVAAVGIIIYGVVLDKVIYSSDEATMLYIMSRENRKIAARILEELDIGATFLHATGAYSGTEQEILLCVAPKRLYAKVRDIVRDEDENAFTIVTKANEVFGEGFKNPFTPEI